MSSNPQGHLKMIESNANYTAYYSDPASKTIHLVPTSPLSIHKNTKDGKLKPDNAGGGEPPMDRTKKYVTKKRLKREVNKIGARLDELDNSIDAKITKAKFDSVLWLIGTTIAGVAAVGWIFSLIINNIK